MFTFLFARPSCLKSIPKNTPKGASKSTPARSTVRRLASRKSLLALATFGVLGAGFASPALALRRGGCTEVRVVERRCETRVVEACEVRRVWVPARFEERCSRFWVEPVYRTACDRVWVEPIYRTECDRVWVEPVYRTECVNIWVEPRFECVTRVIEGCCGARKTVSERVLLEAGHFIKRENRVLVCAGHFDKVERRVCVREGYFNKVERQELVCAGHWDEVRVNRPCENIGLAVRMSFHH